MKVQNFKYIQDLRKFRNVGCRNLETEDAETCDMVEQAFRSEAMIRSKIFEWHKRFREGRVSVKAMCHNHVEAPMVTWFSKYLRNSLFFGSKLSRLLFFDSSYNNVLRFQSKSN